MDALTQEAVLMAERYLSAYEAWRRTAIDRNTPAYDEAVSRVISMEHAYTPHLARAVLSMAKQLEGSTK
jgi:hypothetical protein